MGTHDRAMARGKSHFVSTIRASQTMWEPLEGGFVLTYDRLGIGKLTCGPEAEICHVEFMHSVVRAETRSYPRASVRRAYLPLQTRVYHLAEDRWRLGRVVKRYLNGQRPASYLIRFPNSLPLELDETELRVRCLSPLADPTEVLAAGATEAQFISDRRAAVLEVLARAREVSRSLGGLLSASVELLPHQIEVVRRVAEDPIQRYLLADEVGLGKTIEAGAIIRQCLADHPLDRVVVLAPAPLIHQWTTELRDRFGLEIGDQLRLVPFERLDDIDPASVDFLVVDEAHHLIKPRVDGNPTPDQLERLAVSSHRLLLLSATPVLDNPEATLALLHLLDPAKYHLDDREAFELRLRHRQAFGRLLLSLSPTAPQFILRRVAAALKDLVPDDAHVVELAGRLEAHLGNSDRDAILVDVLEIRNHLIETYRLNRRLMRTRRRDLEGWEIHPRVSKLTVDVDEDGRVGLAADALEEWRYRAVLSIGGNDARHHAGPVDTNAATLRTRYLRLVAALGLGVEAAAAEAFRQLREIKPGTNATFPDDEALLARLTDTGAAENEGQSRSEHAADIVDYVLRSLEARQGAPKIVVFATSTALIGDTARRLDELRGIGVTHLVTSSMAQQDVEASIRKFRDAKVPAALLCDRSGEEGLNLQFATGVVHLDLPLEPLRMEQRIGRVDRIGRAQADLIQRVVVPSDEGDAPWCAWIDLLRQGFRVFDETIADLQLALDPILTEVGDALFFGGAGGLRVAIPQVKALISQERARLDEQYALDRLEMGEADAHTLFERLDDAEKTDQELARGLTGWWEDVLHLDSRAEAEPMEFRLRWSDQTLVPHDPWEEALAPVLGPPLTFNRTTAINHVGTRLVRSGSPLVEVLPGFLRYDDRGTAFSTWRVEPGWDPSLGDPWVGFKLVYIVEVDADAIAARVWPDPDPVDTAAIQRRADVLFPPWVETHFVDAGLRPITEPSSIAVLARPYDKRVAASGRRDINLGSRPGALAEVADPTALSAVCKTLGVSAPDLVREETVFVRRLHDAQVKASTELGALIDQLERRRSAQMRDSRLTEAALSIELSVARETLLEIERPSVRLDTIGLLVVSSHPPSAAN